MRSAFTSIRYRGTKCKHTTNKRLLSLSLRAACPCVFNKFTTPKTTSKLKTRTHERTNKQNACSEMHTNASVYAINFLRHCVHERSVFILHALIYLFHIFVNVFTHEDDALNASHRKAHFPKIEIEIQKNAPQTQTEMIII